MEIVRSSSNHYIPLFPINKGFYVLYRFLHQPAPGFVTGPGLVGCDNTIGSIN